jgi:mannose-6-phosphate isomerase
MIANDPFGKRWENHPNSADSKVKDEEAPVYGTPENIRPWGEYHILYDDDSCKVKKIIVNPGGKLSYQYHYKRNEVWCVTEGTGIFTLDGVNTICVPGDTLVIPTLAKHMIENTGTEPLVFIEVQRGSYFGEDDIVRISDAYGRG